MSNRALEFTAERLLHILRSLPAVNAYIVGFSGGADSTALLHALGKIRQELGVPLSAAHVNHAIHPDADLWQQQCKDFCHQQGIELTCLDINLDKRSGKGLEADARHLRYQAISALLGPADCLLTAHHADDQAETLFLNLMRGSGVEGLTAMPESRPLGKGLLQRPLLRFTNSALKDYLCNNGLAWIEDPSNQSMNHDRNFVRHEIIPRLEQRWPGVSQRLLLTRQAMTSARRLLEGLATDYLVVNLGHPYVLHLTPDCMDKPEMLRLVVRCWIKQADAPGIPAYRLGSFCNQVQQAVSGHKVSLRWDGWILRLYRQQLWVQPDSIVQDCPALGWPEGQGVIELGEDVGQMLLGTAATTGNGPEAAAPEYPVGEFSVGSRVSLDEHSIYLGGVHKSLKNVFQNAGIPPWLRDSIPICSLDGEPVAVGDWCFNERFARWLSENSTTLNWRPIHPLLQFIRTQQHALRY